MAVAPCTLTRQLRARLVSSGWRSRADAAAGAAPGGSAWLRPGSRSDLFTEPRISAPVTLYTIRGGGHVVSGPTKAPRVRGRTTRRVVVGDAIEEFFGLPGASSPIT